MGGDLDDHWFGGSLDVARERDRHRRVRRQGDAIHLVVRSSVGEDVETDPAPQRRVVGAGCAQLVQRGVERGLDVVDEHRGEQGGR